MGIESSEKSRITSPEKNGQNLERDRYERVRLVAHLGRVFTRNYQLEVLPSNVWATGFSKDTERVVKEYMSGDRDTLVDLSPDAFNVTRLLYDKNQVHSMEMEDIWGILHHEAGHFKFSDFRTMIEGQKTAIDQGNLPTSFWLMYEGIEDPRVNNLEGKGSPAIDRQIRESQGRGLHERLKEIPITKRPKMFQFAYNSLNYWLHGEQIPGLKETEVGKITDTILPLLDQYYENTDIDQRRELLTKIWDAVKILESIDIEDEKKKQVAKQKGMKGDRPGTGGKKAQQSQGNASGGEDSNDVGLQFPGGTGQEGAESEIDADVNNSNESSTSGDLEKSNGNDGQLKHTRRGLLDRIKKAIFGGNQGNEKSDKEERLDLDSFTPEQLQQIQDEINNMTPMEQAQLEMDARNNLDEDQKEILQEQFSKTLNLKKNSKTGDYEAEVVMADEDTQNKAKDELDKAIQEVEQVEAYEDAQDEQRRNKEEQLRKILNAKRKEQAEMEKAGFDENEKDKFLLYQALENSMYGLVRNFRNAMEKIIPRRKEGIYEGGFFSGPKIDRRDLIRKAPLGNEQFHMRQVEKPIGDPRLFIGLLVDNSGSMSGEKQEQARKTMIFFASVCKEMGIPFMAASFGENSKMIKEFKQDFDNPAERIKPAIIDNTDASDGSTNLHVGLEITINSMNEMRRKVTDSHGIIFVVTDGDANVGLTGADLKEYIRDNRGRLTFKGFGLAGPGERGDVKKYLNSYFGEGNCAFPQKFEDLPDEAFRVLRVNLIQFQKYLT